MISNSLSQAALADHIHLDPQKLLKLFYQSSMIQKSRPFLELHQQVYIALRFGLPPGHRVECTNIASTVPMRRI